MANLVQKMIDLQERVGDMHKQGRYRDNRAQYEYHKADDLWDALRPAMRELGIWSTLEIVGSSSEGFVSKGGTAGVRTVIDMVVHVVNADDPADKLAFKWRGAGQDFSDKDITKATTLAHKYWWLHTLKVGDGGESDSDTENLNQPDREEDVRRATPAVVAPGVPAIAPKAEENGEDKKRWADVTPELQQYMVKLGADLKDAPGAPTWFDRKVAALCDAKGAEAVLVELFSDHVRFCKPAPGEKCAHGVDHPVAAATPAA